MPELSDVNISAFGSKCTCFFFVKIWGKKYVKAATGQVTGSRNIQ